MASALQLTEIQLFNALKTKLGEQEAEQLVAFVKTQIQQEIHEQLPFIATKEDIAKLETKIAQTESKLILWAFVFWVTQLGAIFAFLKFFR
jgi:hypothetical protein